MGADARLTRRAAVRRVLGVSIPDYHGAILDDRLRVARLALGAPSPARGQRPTTVKDRPG